MDDEKEIIKDIIETGSEMTGGVGGAIVGTLLAGPMGVVIGGIAGPLITKTFKIIGTEIKERVFGKKEEVRVGAAFTFALGKLNEKINEGENLRDDDFFKAKNNERPNSEEILEGVILGAQREYEERKVKFLGNLYANICLNNKVSREHASQLIKTATNISFRQFCMLQLLREDASDLFNFKIKFRPWGSSNTLSRGDAIIEIRDLQQRGLVSIRVDDTDKKDKEEFDSKTYLDNSEPIFLNHIKITQLGVEFCEMLSLEEIDAETLKEVNSVCNLRVDD
jgi:hypothetical protein